MDIEMMQARAENKVDVLQEELKLLQSRIHEAQEAVSMIQNLGHMGFTTESKAVDGQAYYLVCSNGTDRRLDNVKDLMLWYRNIFGKRLELREAKGKVDEAATFYIDKYG